MKFNYSAIFISFSYLSLVPAQYIVDSALIRDEYCLSGECVDETECNRIKKSLEKEAS